MEIKNSESTGFPDIDVVILSWNRIDMTIQTIHNILNQTNVKTHVWVVDQGSDQHSVEKLRAISSQYSNVTLKLLDKNVGVPGGRNLGMNMGNAEYTVSIDNDAVFEATDALSKVVKEFDKDSRLGAISFKINNFYTGEDEEFSWVYPQALKQKQDHRFMTTRYCGCGHAIRRSAFFKAGEYDASLFFCWEEIDLSYRLINVGYHLIYEPSIVVLHKCSPEARINWKDKRFYFTVRNAVYIYLKYASQKWKAFILMGGYCTKGLYNKLPYKSLKGCIDAIKMYRSFLSLEHSNLGFFELSPEAEDYLYQHEGAYRGNLLSRIKNEVFTHLPQSRNSNHSDKK